MRRFREMPGALVAASEQLTCSSSVRESARMRGQIINGVRSMGVTPDHHLQLRLPDTTEDRRPFIAKDHTQDVQ